MTTPSSPRGPQVPEHGLDFGFAIQVQSLLGDVALLPGADATAGRAATNVSLLTDTLDPWEMYLADPALPFSSEARDLVHKLLVSAGQLLEDVSSMAERVISWKERRRDSTPGNFTAVSKTVFDSPRAKTILSSLQYLQKAIQLIIQVVRFAALKEQQWQNPTSNDGRTLLRRRIYLRGLLKTAHIALNYTRSRASQELAADEVAPPTPMTQAPAELRSHNLHDLQMQYVFRLKSYTESAESINEQDDHFSYLLRRWTGDGYVDDSDDEGTVFTDLDLDLRSDLEAGMYDHSTQEPHRHSLPLRIASPRATAPSAHARRSSSNEQAQPVLAQRPLHAGSGESHETLRPGPPRAASAVNAPPRGAPPRDRQASLKVDTSIQPQHHRAMTTPASSSARPATESLRPPFPHVDTGSTASTGPPRAPSHHRATSESCATSPVDFEKRPGRDSGSHSMDSAVEHSEPETDDEVGNVAVSWRVNVPNRGYYDFEGRKLVRQPPGVEPQPRRLVFGYIRSHDTATTEIPTNMVSRAALEDRRFVEVKELPPNGMTTSMWSIPSVLQSRKVIDLVETTKELERQREGATRAQIAAAQAARPQASTRTPRNPQPPPPALMRNASAPPTSSNFPGRLTEPRPMQRSPALHAQRRPEAMHRPPTDQELSRYITLGGSEEPRACPPPPHDQRDPWLQVSTGNRAPYNSSNYTPPQYNQSSTPFQQPQPQVTFINNQPRGSTSGNNAGYSYASGGPLQPPPPYNNTSSSGRPPLQQNIGLPPDPRPSSHRRRQSKRRDLSTSSSSRSPSPAHRTRDRGSSRGNISRGDYPRDNRDNRDIREVAIRDNDRDRDVRREREDNNRQRIKKLEKQREKTEREHASVKKFVSTTAGIGGVVGFLEGLADVL